MPKLFKYCKHEHMTAVLSRGSVRIGTLHGWRDTGTHGEMTRDEFEGVIRLAGNFIFYDASHIAAFDHRPSDSTVTVEGQGENQARHFQNHFLRSSDMLTFSTSSTYSEAQHRMWLASEGYDACYRINSPHLFLRAVTAAMAGPEFVLSQPAIYVPAAWSNLEVFGPFHPALLKRAGGYDDQREVRAIWRGQNGSDLRPFVIERSQAGIYCEAHRTI